MEYENKPIRINAANIEHVEVISDPLGTVIIMMNGTKARRCYLKNVTLPKVTLFRRDAMEHRTIEQNPRSIDLSTVREGE